MIRNYIKIAWRNLLRNKVYALINILGLSLGLACAMLILLYVKDEVSFDRFHENGDNIYRVVAQAKHDGQLATNVNTGFLQGPRFAENVSGITSFVRVQGATEDMKNGNEIYSQSALRVDSTFLSVFSFPVIEGNAKTALSEPHSIVVTEDFAQKQFGKKEALGQLVMIRQDSAFVPYKVTTVTKNAPQNSTIRYEVLLPFRESKEDAQNNENWYSSFLNTFVVLNPNADKSHVEAQMKVFYQKDARETFQSLLKKYGGSSEMGTYILQPFADIHMNTEMPAQNGLANASNPMYSYILSGIALFVLLIACINFVNLTVARSVKRAREIGIRKVVGSNRKQLIFQFLGESFLLCFIAFSLAFLIAQLVLPVFNELSNKALALSYLADTKLIIGYILLFLVTGLLAGFYPALTLSGYKPVEVLYSRFQISGKNYLQKSLVVLQFALASFLIIATITIYRQFDFLINTDLGYNDSNIIMVDNFSISEEKARLFKTEVLKNPEIIDVAPTNVGHSWTGARLENGNDMSFNYVTIDESYIPEMEIPIVQGRNFSEEHPSDATTAILVNEAFVKEAKWDNPIGQTVNFFYNDDEIYRVVGVVKNYHFLSLNQEIGPQLFTMKPGNDFDSFYIKIKPNSAGVSLEHIRQTFQQIFPLSPFSYNFKDEENRRSYEAEEKWKQILLFGAVLTIFISCIGLFGLSVLSAEKRTKEIGIRKVLGASVKNIVTILSTDFIKLVMISLVIAIPIAWYVSNKWLENYPYRVNVNWEMFAIAIGLVVLIALFTISFQAIRVAIQNPVKSLKTE
ncbi:MAG: ABC transporter permease [Christiangramia sp.]|nr:antibiotic ABC transporter permease [Christiangramia sp.]